MARLVCANDARWVSVLVRMIRNEEQRFLAVTDFENSTHKFQNEDYLVGNRCGVVVRIRGQCLGSGRTNHA